MTPYLEKTQHRKRPGRMVQVVECVLSKHKTLHSNLSTAKKKLIRHFNRLWGMCVCVCLRERQTDRDSISLPRYTLFYIISLCYM
jgi:hypothetical protein